MLVLLTILLITSAYAQGVNDTGQKPTEEKQGGEYSGFEETGRQTEGLPTRETNATPAPITGLDVNQTTTAETAVEPTSPYGIGLFAGLGAAAAVAIVAAAWYFKKNRSM